MQQTEGLGFQLAFFECQAIVWHMVLLLISAQTKSSSD